MARKLIIVLLSLYLIAFAAELTWRLIPQPAMTASPAQTAVRINQRSTTSAAQPINLSAIKALKLFGDIEQAAPEEEVTDAPQTQLSLTLTGVVTSTNKKEAAAIIENRGTQNTYGLDEKIDGTNAFLHAVFGDRVIIRNGSRRETLMLDGEDYDTPSQSRAPSRELTARAPASSNRITGQAAKVTEQLRQQPLTFTDYIAITPYRVDGQMQGYQIRPGRNPELFSAAGLQTGDVVTDINGLDLSDPQQSIEAMKVLRTAESLQITVNRDGELQTLDLNFPASEQNR